MKNKLLTLVEDRGLKKGVADFQVGDTQAGGAQVGDDRPALCACFGAKRR